jgi:hypothetical protein
VSVSIGSLFGEVELGDKFSEPLIKLAEYCEMGGKSFKALAEAGGIAVGVVASLSIAIFELGERGSEVGHVSETFDRLSGSVGSTGAVMLGALRSGVQGTISDFDLMRTANASLNAGVVKNAGDFNIMARAALLLGQQGGGTANALDTITRAMETGMSRGLKHLGVLVDNKDAMAAYEMATGKSAATMSAHETATVKAHAVLEALKQKLAETGDTELSFEQKAQQAKVAMSNFTDALAVSVSQSPVVMQAMTFVSDRISQAFGSAKADQVQNLTGFVNKFVIAMVSAADSAVTVAEFITNAFNGTKLIVADILEGMSGGVKMVMDSVHSFVELAATAPGALGAPYRALLPTLTGVKDLTDSLAINYKKGGQEAYDAAAKAQAGFDAAHKTLGDMQTQLMLVDGQLVKIPKSAEDLKKIADAANANAAATMAWNKEQAKAQEAADKLALEGLSDYKRIQDEITLANAKGVNERQVKMQQAEDAEVIALGKKYGTASDTYSRLAALVAEKYNQMRAAEDGYYSQSSMANRKYEADIQQLQTTGTQAKLLALKTQEQAELDGLAQTYGSASTHYTQLAALVAEKYRLMALQAQGYYATVEQAAAAAGFQTQAEMEQTAEVALETYNEMLDSGLYTYKTLQKAHEAYKKAEAAANDEAYMDTKAKFELIASAASGILRSIFGKSKAAAIAAVIIDTAQGVIKSFAQYGWPWGLAPAAAIVAAGAESIGKINSQGTGGFALGTPGTSFGDFGSGSLEMLHGKEAVINEHGADTLADMVTAAAHGNDAEILASLKELVGVVRRQSQQQTAAMSLMPTLMKGALQEAMG